MEACGKLICSNQMENRGGRFSEYGGFLLFTFRWQKEIVKGQLSKSYSIKFGILVAASQEQHFGGSASGAWAAFGRLDGKKV